MADTAMPRPTRSRTGLVPALAHRSMLDGADLQIPGTGADRRTSAEESAFGEVHPRHMITIPTYLTMCAPRVVVATRPGQR